MWAKARIKSSVLICLSYTLPYVGKDINTPCNITHK